MKPRQTLSRPPRWSAPPHPAVPASFAEWCLRASLFTVLLLMTLLVSFLLVSQHPPLLPRLRDARHLGTWSDPLLVVFVLLAPRLSWAVCRSCEAHLYPWFRSVPPWIAGLLATSCGMLSMGTTVCCGGVLCFGLLVSTPDLVQSTSLDTYRIDVIQRPQFEGSHLILAVTRPDGEYVYQAFDSRAIPCADLTAEAHSSGVFITCDGRVVANVSYEQKSVNLVSSYGVNRDVHLADLWSNAP